VEEEKWVTKRTHQTTFGIKSSSTNSFFAITIKKEKMKVKEKKT
jgi:hypothetical protein